MLDINLIRETPDVVRESLRKRQMDPAPVDDVLKLDVERRSLLSEVETLKAERNKASKEISQIKDKDERQAKIDAMRQVGDKIAELDGRVHDV
jgi:seryl-tRNA synthetase